MTDICFTPLSDEDVERVRLLAKTAPSERPKPARSGRSVPGKHFIIRLLLHIGLELNANNTAVIAALIDMLAFDPEVTIERAVEHFASRHGAKAESIYYIVDKTFNVYDPELMERISKVTATKPQTSKDVLCDLALFVRMHYIFL